MAITKYDQFDFLIDIVPRDELKPAKKEETKTTSLMGSDQVCILFILSTFTLSAVSRPTMYTYPFIKK
jgi:nuclear transcription factor Y gamma